MSLNSLLYDLLVMEIMETKLKGVKSIAKPSTNLSNLSITNSESIGFCIGVS